MWSISLPCLIYPSSLFSVKWWIKCDTLKSATLAGGLIWAEGISVFKRRRKSSFHSNVCGCINSGYFWCCVIKTQLTLLWDKQEYTGSQLKSEGGGVSSWGKACVNPEHLIMSRRCNLSTFTHPQVLPPSSLNKFAPVGSLVVAEQGCRCKRSCVAKILFLGRDKQHPPLLFDPNTQTDKPRHDPTKTDSAEPVSLLGLLIENRSGITPSGVGVTSQKGAPGKKKAFTQQEWMPL